MFMPRCDSPGGPPCKPHVLGGPKQGPYGYPRRYPHGFDPEFPRLDRMVPPDPAVKDPNPRGPEFFDMPVFPNGQGAPINPPTFGDPRYNVIRMTPDQYLENFIMKLFK